MINFLVFSLINIAISTTVHFFVKNYFLAALISSPISLIAVVITDRITLGYFDPLIIVTFILGLIYSFIYALVVGIPFLVVRKKRKKT